MNRRFGMGYRTLIPIASAGSQLGSDLGRHGALSECGPREGPILHSLLRLQRIYSKILAIQPPSVISFLFWASSQSLKKFHGTCLLE